MNDHYQLSYGEAAAALGFNSSYNSASNATLRGQIMWNGKPVIDDDDGGTAGVREPRRPRPPLAPAAMAIEPEFAFA